MNGNRLKRVLTAAVVLILARPASAEDYDVVIAGGTTAAFAAAVAAAEEGARTCLIEPTDWVGGQLTSSGVPAVDEAWHKIVDPKTKKVAVDVTKIGRDPRNMTPSFKAMLDAMGRRGGAWVSDYCFEPKDLIETQLSPMERRLKKLTVLRDTVVKSVNADPKTKKIRSITVIQRTPKPGVNWEGYDHLPSQDIPDWYSPLPSDRFEKAVTTIASRQEGGKGTVFLDATEWGELMALSGASYLLGVESSDGAREGDDHCGQSTVFGVVEKINATPVEEAPMPTGVEGLGFGDYSGRADAWEQIWTYRRLTDKGKKPTVGDVSLQNWGYARRLKQGGNDYPFGYLFKSKEETAREIGNWKGGVDLEVMAGAERRALAWHGWFREHTPKSSGFDPKQVTLAVGVLGTGHGLAKLPYIRDTRRSVGIGGFLLTLGDLCGYPARITGKPFLDRVALGSYPADIHHIVSCKYPAYTAEHRETLPFYIPFRSLTNETYSNLLVAGKTMAQSFMANSATRLHPIEWSTGTAAGVAAAYMARTGSTSSEALAHIDELQRLIKRKTPIDYIIEGKMYPPAGATPSL